MTRIRMMLPLFAFLLMILLGSPCLPAHADLEDVGYGPLDPAVADPIDYGPPNPLAADPIVYGPPNPLAADPVVYGPPYVATADPYMGQMSEAMDANEESAIPDPEPILEPQPLYYTIRAGDTLYQVAASFGVDMDALESMNGIADPRRLQIGQKLRVPVLEGLPSGIGGQITEVLNATLTAYTSGYESTGKTASDPAYGVTASGTTVQEGRTVAVDPRVIPIGSTLFIEGVGIRKAEDTGSAIRGKKIDIYIADLDKARDFGVKPNVNVYVLRDSGSL